MHPDSNPSAIYNLELCDFCTQLAVRWAWLTPDPSWTFQPHTSVTKHQHNIYRVCSFHGGPFSPTIQHTPLDVTHKLG